MPFGDWPQLIGESVLLRQRLNQLDPEVNPYTIPHVGAAIADLDAAEQEAGIRLDEVHRELLTYANGWEDFFVFTHLFAAEEIGVSSRWQKATEMLDVLFAEGPPPEGMPPASELTVIAANADDVEDLFVLWTGGPLTDHGHQVSWLAGDETQRFSNGHELVLAVNEYLRRKLAKLQC